MRVIQLRQRRIQTLARKLHKTILQKSIVLLNRLRHRRTVLFTFYHFRSHFPILHLKIRCFRQFDRVIRNPIPKHRISLIKALFDYSRFRVFCVWLDFFIALVDLELIEEKFSLKSLVNRLVIIDFFLGFFILFLAPFSFFHFWDSLCIFILNKVLMLSRLHITRNRIETLTIFP